MGMTNEEKIDILCRLRSDITVFIPRFKHQYCATLNEIIEELEQQPCEDAISRDAVEKITWEEPSYDDALNVLTEVRDKVRALPSVKPERPNGEWIRVKPEEEGGFPVWKCSKCGCEIYSESKQDRKKFHAFCGACGAKMKEGGNDEN